MADSWSIVETDWQGVDDEPTAESENLVKSGGVSKMLLSNYFIGKGNTFVSTTINGLIAGKKYRISLDRDNWDISQVTSTGVFVFAIDSYDANGNYSRIINTQITQFNDLKDSYIFTIPNDSQYITVGGRANNGLKIKFIIEEYGYIEDIANYSEILFSQKNIASEILNGTPNNHSNGSAVRTSKLYVIPNHTIEVFTDRPVSEGYYYAYVFMFRDRNNNIILNASAATVGHKRYIVPENSYTVEYGIFELDSNEQPHTIRDTDFTGYSIYYKDITEDIFYNTADSLKNDYQKEGIVYFTNAAYPTFELLTTTDLKVTLPTETMRLYNNRGVAVELDLTTLPTRVFVLSSLKKLVYNYDSNTISLVNTNQSGNYYVLLSVGGAASTTGSIDGGLRGYYLNWLHSVILNESKKYTNERLSLKTVASQILDGTPNNPSNTSAVRTSKMTVIEKRTIEIFTDRPAAEGYYYTYVLMFRDKNGAVVLNAQNATVGHKRYIVPDNSYTVELGIFEFDSNAQPHTIRATDFAGYSIYFVDITANILYDTVSRVDRLESGSKDNAENINKWADFKFLFFSDVHASWTNVQRIVDYANKLGNAKCDCIINGGDSVAYFMGNGLSDYNAIIDNCSFPVLNVAGNHDCWTDSWVWADKLAVYNLITAKVKEQVPSIVQPDNAATEGLNYYYKDFANIRVICLLAMQNGTNNLYFDAAQQTWFENVLENARTTYHYYKTTQYGLENYTLQEGDTITDTLTNIAELNTRTGVVANQIYRVPMSVIVVTHAPYTKSEAERVSEKLCSWYDYKKSCRTKNLTSDSLQVNNAAVTAVNTYIQNGGSFICWLTGHTHADNILINNVYQGQFMINILTANHEKHFDGYSGSTEVEDNYDAFDYIGVDLLSGMIKVLRIGWSEDSSMRNRRSWCYDYVNKKLLSEN